MVISSDCNSICLSDRKALWWHQNCMVVVGRVVVGVSAAAGVSVVIDVSMVVDVSVVDVTWRDQK